MEQPKELLIEGTNGTGYDFKFWKIGRAMTVLTDFNVEMRMNRQSVTIQVPYEDYFDNVVGFCKSSLIPTQYKVISIWNIEKFLRFRKNFIILGYCG